MIYGYYGGEAVRNKDLLLEGYHGPLDYLDEMDGHFLSPTGREYIGDELFIARVYAANPHIYPQEIVDNSKKLLKIQRRHQTPVNFYNRNENIAKNKALVAEINAARELMRSPATILKGVK